MRKVSLGDPKWSWFFDLSLYAQLKRESDVEVLGSLNEFLEGS